MPVTFEFVRHNPRHLEPWVGVGMLLRLVCRCAGARTAQIRIAGGACIPRAKARAPARTPGRPRPQPHPPTHASVPPSAPQHGPATDIVMPPPARARAASRLLPALYGSASGPRLVKRVPPLPRACAAAPGNGGWEPAQPRADAHQRARSMAYLLSWGKACVCARAVARDAPAEAADTQSAGET